MTATDDVDLAVDLVNTLWVVADPPERLTSTDAVREIARARAAGTVATELRDDDLAALLRLREEVRPVFGAADVAEATARINTLVEELPLAPRLVVEAGSGRGATHGTVGWDLSAGLHGVDALRARIAGALAGQVERSGTQRIGVCAAAPCTCVYVDRSRARTRRYCCDQCNDRAAAAAYRRRHA
jgi:predicted RNA-binding Zn ribbon-like protein